MNLPAEQCDTPPFLPEHGVLAAWLAKGMAHASSSADSVVRTFINPPRFSSSIYVP